MCRQLTDHSHLLLLQGFQQALIACRVDVAYESAACIHWRHRWSQRAAFQPAARMHGETHIHSWWGSQLLLRMAPEAQENLEAQDSGGCFTLHASGTGCSPSPLWVGEL